VKVIARRIPKTGSAGEPDRLGAMATLLGASEEVEATLKFARDSVESEIARYRIGVFATLVVLVVVSNLVAGIAGQPTTFVPALWFAVCTTYAVAMRRIVARIGAPAWVIYASIALDMLAMVANFAIIAGTGTKEVRTASPVFAAHLAAPGILLIMLVGSLRAHRKASIFAGLFGSVCILVTLIPLEGFHPAQIPLALGIWIAAVVCIAAARQARTNLDDFARLRLLRRYLSPAAVERVMRENPDAALALGGRLLTVTLLAADLRGFTAMSEKMSPDEVVRQLNAYHGTMLERIEEHGGALDKFIGDGILVVFGLDPETRHADDGAAAAVACARDMLVALDRHNAERAGEGNPALRMGIGVHTGPVVAGNIGAPGRRLEFTVIGDAVNTAARLEGLTKEAATPVLISSDTVDRLNERGGLRELPAMQAKGRSEKTRVFHLEGPTS
jgi:class 3 adenylate cyclase